jgi:uncharacterized Tic20 family protein
MKTSKQEKILATIPHILALLPIPLFNILVVYVFLLTFGRRSDFVSTHTKENLNFQISYQLYVVLFFLAIYLWNRISPLLENMSSFLENFQIIQLVGVGIAFLYFGAVLLHWLIILFLLVAAIVKALLGKSYKFPLVIRLFK